MLRFYSYDKKFNSKHFLKILTSDLELKVFDRSRSDWQISVFPSEWSTLKVQNTFSRTEVTFFIFRLLKRWHTINSARCWEKERFHFFTLCYCSVSVKYSESAALFFNKNFLILSLFQNNEPFWTKRLVLNFLDLWLFPAQNSLKLQSFFIKRFMFWD